MTKSMKKAIALCLFSMGVVGLMAQSNEFKIDVQKTGAPIQSTMYGIFFEDINYGADGGLYAELVKNRSFEFENPFGGWTPFGNVSVQTQKPCFDRNPHYVRLSYEKELTGTGLDNEGFNGIGIREGEKYDFSLYARTRSGDAPVKLRINLVDSRNDLYEQKEIEVSGKEEIYGCSDAGSDRSPFPSAYHDGDKRNCRSRTYFIVSTKDIQQPSERHAC